MARFWSRRRGGRDAEDPELESIFPRRVDPDGDLLWTATQLRHALQAQRADDPDPDYRLHLRASLMEEARLHHQQKLRPRHRLGLALGTGMGLAGLAMLGVVLVSLVALPQGDPNVVVQASVQGKTQVAVTQAIDLSFNQPMVETSVIRGLQIEPAVTVKTSWPTDRRLRIQPVHDLVPNVPYVVRIAKTAARAQNGATPLSNIVIPFGTGPITGSPGQPPKLVAVSTIATASGSQSVQYAADGELMVTASGNLSVAGQPPVTAPAASPGSGGVVYALANPPAVLATAAVNPVASPDSQELAFLRAAASGGSTLNVVQIGGSASPQVLASSNLPSPSVAWVNDGTILYPDQGHLYEVGLDGRVTAVYPFVHLGPDGHFRLDPSGQALYAAPSGTPTVYDLATGTATSLTGLQGTPAFSPTGSLMAFVVSQQGRQTIMVATATGQDTRPLVVAPSGVGISDLAFSPNGSYIAYLADTAGLGSRIGVLDVASGNSQLLSTRTGMGLFAWSPEGNSMSALEAGSQGSSQVLTLQLSTPPAPAPTSSPANASALEAASSLAQIQVAQASSGPTAAAALLAPGLKLPTPTLLPIGYDRFYAISSTPVGPGSNSYQVSVELVRDATTNAPAESLLETVTVQVSATAAQIVSVVPGQPTALPAGPIVISASATSSSPGQVTFVLTFDADLDPTTVGATSVQLVDAGQQVQGLSISYQASTRQVLVSASGLAPGPLVLTVGAPLADVDHAEISTPYSLQLPALPTPAP